MSHTGLSRLMTCLNRPCDDDRGGRGIRRRTLFDACLCGWKQGTRCRAEHFIQEVDRELARSRVTMPRSVQGCQCLIDAAAQRVAARMSTYRESDIVADLMARQAQRGTVNVKPAKPVKPTRNTTRKL
jgi:hypothetical protein